ncbi:MAG: EAL domain-containing protein [Gammaproteobacteria bacterium]|nr:EAL domain-containing protein [Gammaproteobacteria bacterium]
MVTDDKSLLGIVVGFAAVLGLMALSIIAALMAMAANQHSLEAVVQDHMVKIALATRMHNASRERTVRLYQMALDNDPFRRDALWQGYTQFAEEFIKARTALTSMPLSATEQTLLDDQRAATRVAKSYQDEVIEFLERDKPQSARVALLTKLVPAQDKMLESLQRIYDLQIRAAIVTTEEATEVYQQTRWMSLLLALVVVVSGAAIGAVVIARTRQARMALYNEKKKAQVTLDSMVEGVLVVTADGCVDFVNPVAERLCGWSENDARGREAGEVLSGAVQQNGDNPLIDATIAARCEDEAIVNTTGISYRCADNSQKVIEYTVSPMRDPTGAVLGAVILLRDVTEMRALGMELNFQTRHDLLTGVLNRNEFENQLQFALEGARGGMLMHAYLHIDIDWFKRVNDTLGRPAGDAILRQIASVLSGRTQETDLIARLGSDEFGVLLVGCSEQRAEQVAEEIRAAVHYSNFYWNENGVNMTVSVGVAPIAADCGSVYDVLRAGDFACVAAKERGRNIVHTFKSDDRSLVLHQSRVHWMQRVTRALENDRFCLYAETISPLADYGQGPLGYELLLRMLDDDGHLVYPMAFLPAAERYEMMPAIDRWVVEYAFAKLSALDSAAFNKISCFNINLSGQSICERSFAAFLIRALRSGSVPPDKICFEITESAAVTNIAQAMNLMTSLRKLGVRFALDDFGRGTSSFEYLKNLPIDYIKIDGIFVRNIYRDQTDYELVKSVGQIAKIMGIKTVAEYVENDRVKNTLIELGIHYGQGSGISHPMSLSDVILHLNKGTDTSPMLVPLSA